jgi:hypothetical protein
MARTTGTRPAGNKRPRTITVAVPDPLMTIPAETLRPWKALTISSPTRSTAKLRRPERHRSGRWRSELGSSAICRRQTSCSVTGSAPRAACCSTAPRESASRISCSRLGGIVQPVATSCIGAPIGRHGSLFIDGEMSRRLLKRRAEDLVRRLGTLPENLFLFSHEDMEGFQPLNTPAGAEFVDRIVRQLGSVDLIIFDNIMSLVAGDMREEEGWQRVLPLINSLTKQGVAQIWVHQTGHDSSHSYGTKTREWRMDTVLHLAEAARPDTDVSFRLEFRKARERTPETRNDFADAEIALVLDEWTSSAAAERRQQPSPTGQKFLEALRSVFATVEPIQFQTWNAVKSEDWRAECVTLGLLDLDKPHSARTLFGKYKRELIAADLIACNNELVWLR